LRGLFCYLLLLLLLLSRGLLCGDGLGDVRLARPGEDLFVAQPAFVCELAEVAIAGEKLFDQITVIWRQLHELFPFWTIPRFAQLRWICIRERRRGVKGKAAQ
jgi:hypothetical protein